MTEHRKPGTWGRVRGRLGFGLSGAASENAWLGRWLVLPALVFTGVLVVYPIIVGLSTSVHEATPTLGTPSPFVGLENYREVLQQPSVGDSTVQTIFYVLTALVLEIGLGLAIAVLLHRTFRGRGIVLAILILPWALPSVVSGVLWRRIFDPDTGLLNSFLVQTGIIDQPHVWLADQGWATLFITLVHVWGVLPLVTLVFIAGSFGHHALGAHHVAHGHDREAGAVGTAVVGVRRGRPRGALAAAEDVHAHDEVPVEVDAGARADEPVPPARRQVTRTGRPGDVAVAGEGVADEHGVRPVGVEGPEGLVGDHGVAELPAALERERAPGAHRDEAAAAGLVPLLPGTGRRQGARVGPASEVGEGTVGVHDAGERAAGRAAAGSVAIRRHVVHLPPEGGHP